jgi:hypothetical protein
MAEITGKNLVVTWAYSGGTVNLNTDFRTLSINPNIDLAETTAGADTDKTYIATIKDATIEWSGLYQSAGTALVRALEAGTGGTLTVYPEGTASGKQKDIYPAIAMGAKINIPYADVVEISCTFQKNGPKA